MKMLQGYALVLVGSYLMLGKIEAREILKSLTLFKSAFIVQVAACSVRIWRRSNLPPSRTDGPHRFRRGSLRFQQEERGRSFATRLLFQRSDVLRLKAITGSRFAIARLTANSSSSRGNGFVRNANAPISIKSSRNSSPLADITITGVPGRRFFTRFNISSSLMPSMKVSVITTSYFRSSTYSSAFSADSAISHWYL